MMKKILIAADGSESSIKALKMGVELAEKCRAQLILLTVIPLDPIYGPPKEVNPSMEMHFPIFIEQPPTEEIEKAYREGLEQLAEKYVPAELAKSLLAESGTAAEVICEVAEKQKADLIVMGSRGMSQLKGILLGSVSDRVCHRAHCAVMIVR